MQRQPMADTRPLDAVADTRLAARHLGIFRHVLEDPVGRAFLALLELLRETSASPAGNAEAERVLQAYTRLTELLAEEVELGARPPFGDAWQNHLLERILADENVFGRKAESSAPEAMGPSLWQAAVIDLRRLQVLHRADGAALANAAAHAAGLAPDDLVSLDGFRSLARTDGPLARGEVAEGRDEQMKRTLDGSADWGRCAEALARYYAGAGTGRFGRYWSFRWVRRGLRGRLEGVPEPDPVRLEDLVSYQAEREEVIRNTEQFVAGHPANNVLLYGDRGTGKSSTIKALLWAYGHRGLRLVEVSKRHLVDLPAVLELLRRRPQRFILYVDDLSFEEGEPYQDLKSLLEGGLAVRPGNVLLYATSNRRHLVREYFSDRAAAVVEGEVQPQDTMQEKLSLADRFGITVVFPAPDQEGFLAIVERLAERHGLRLNRGDLRRLALEWVQWHNGRSPRTARQFVDSLVGRQRLGGEWPRPGEEEPVP